MAEEDLVDMAAAATKAEGVAQGVGNDLRGDGGEDAADLAPKAAKSAVVEGVHVPGQSRDLGQEVLPGRAGIVALALVLLQQLAQIHWHLWG